MRNKVKLETLSSVHVGSGDKKVLGIDFLYTPNRIYFLDTLRIGEALNITSNPKIAAEWSKCVLAGKQEVFFVEHNVDYRKFSRSVVNYVDEFSDSAPSISMMMRDGRGIAYIPGSSIKGAIRTAIFAQLSKNEIDNAYVRAKNEADQEPNRRKAKRIEENSLKAWANNFFGKISNDSFRFLRVGDAFFDNPDDLAVINTAQIKKSRTNPRLTEIDNIKQYAEVLLKFSESTFFIDLDSKEYTELFKNGSISREVPQFKDIKSLFKLINEHTIELLQSEINIWKEIDGAELMCKSLALVSQEINECSENECVLRLGNGSGKRFITGGILENIDFDPEPIPKTRRFEEYVEDGGKYHGLLGFVKLTLIED